MIVPAFPEDFPVTGPDNTGQIQAALNSSKLVILRDHYRVSQTLRMQPGGTIKSISSIRDAVTITRDTVYGPTIVCGEAGQQNNAGACSVIGVTLQHIPKFNTGGSTFIPGATSSLLNIETSPHIAFYKGQDCLVQDVRASGAGGIWFYGCSLPKVKGTKVNGIWDDLFVGLRECTAAIGLVSFTDIDGNKYINTEAHIDDRCYLGGLGHASPRTVIMGNAARAIGLNIGPAFGVYAECAEGLLIESYIGGNSIHNIMLNCRDVMRNVRINKCYIDGAREGSIRIQSSREGVWPVGVWITECGGDGYGIEKHFLVVEDCGMGVPSVVGLNVSGCDLQGYLGSPALIKSAQSVRFERNNLRGYNKIGSTNGDVKVSGGALFEACYDVRSQDNDYGGAENLAVSGNNCQFGSTFLNCDHPFSGGEKGHRLGMLGGYISNISQAY